ncbi:MAG TPA: helix-turn-helix transcriptional regulator [Pyrinomonadaceae bacterium]|jgi:transcriptional regulator with XRE-family HTH domain|nr:helix-turn-helix transcriptional regulator [Pyrinomonadaceae bacterium]
MMGAKLRERRRALGLSQQSLADKLEVSRNTVARWERDEFPNPGFLHLALKWIELEAKKSASKAETKRKTT